MYAIRSYYAVLQYVEKRLFGLIRGIVSRDEGILAILQVNIQLCYPVCLETDFLRQLLLIAVSYNFV